MVQQQAEDEEEQAKIDANPLSYSGLCVAAIHVVATQAENIAAEAERQLKDPKAWAQIRGTEAQWKKDIEISIQGFNTDGRRDPDDIGPIVECMDNIECMKRLLAIETDHEQTLTGDNAPLCFLSGSLGSDHHIHFVTSTSAEKCGLGDHEDGTGNSDDK